MGIKIRLRLRLANGNRQAFAWAAFSCLSERNLAKMLLFTDVHHHSLRERLLKIVSSLKLLLFSFFLLFLPLSDSHHSRKSISRIVSFEVSRHCLAQPSHSNEMFECQTVGSIRSVFKYAKLRERLLHGLTTRNRLEHWLIQQAISLRISSSYS